MPLRIPYNQLPDLSPLQDTDFIPVLRPFEDEGKTTVGDIYNYVRPYTLFVCNMSQAGAAAPTSVDFENTIGFTPVWTYIGAGRYELTSAGPDFPDGYTWIIAEQPVAGSIQTRWVDEYTIDVRTRNNANTEADDILDKNALEVRVYPVPPP